MNILGIIYGLLFVLFSNSTEYTHYETILGGVFVLGLILSTKSWPLKSISWFLPPLLFAILLLIQSIELSKSFADIFKFSKSWISIHVLFAAMAFSPKRKELFIFVGIGMFCGLVINTLEYFQLVDVLGLEKNKSRFGGSLINPNAYSFIAVSVMIWSLIYRETIKIWPLVVIVCMHIIWLQSLSRTYMLVSLLTLSSLVPILSWSRLVAVGIMVLILFNIFSIDLTRTILRFSTIGNGNADLSTVYRLRYIQTAIDYWLDKPLFGWGTDAFRHLNSSSYSHNNYAEVLCNHGLFGFLIYYSFHALVFISALLKKNILVLVAVLAMLLSDIGIVSMVEKSAWFVLYLGIAALMENAEWYSNNRNR